MSDLVPIPGVPGYLVDRFGRVWSIKSGRHNRYRDPHPIRSYRESNGYLRVTLMPFGRLKTFSVHDLVARAFHGPRPDRMVVCHLNDDPADNRPENLVYPRRLGDAYPEDALGQGCLRVPAGLRAGA